jgi:hypothetical protein
MILIIIFLFEFKHYNYNDCKKILGWGKSVEKEFCVHNCNGNFFVSLGNYLSFLCMFIMNSILDRDLASLGKFCFLKYLEARGLVEG